MKEEVKARENADDERYRHYDKLLAFVKILARERSEKHPTIEWMNESARALLKEIKEID